MPIISKKNLIINLLIIIINRTYVIEDLLGKGTFG